MNMAEISGTIKKCKNGLKICDKCGEPIQKVVNIFGEDHIVPVMCSCKIERKKKEKEEQENREKQLRLERLITNSLMDEKFKKETFENWDFSKGDSNLKKVGERYCDKFKQCKENGLGFLFIGNPGNGKTYLSNCIANRLLENYIPVISVSINALLDRIRKTYSTWGQEAEDEIIRRLSNADLLIIDDLGTEQLTDWSRSKIYNIIDSRYRNELPLIITTNKTIEDINEDYGKRTADRILEMCTTMKFTHKSLRLEKSKEKTDLLREIIKERK